MAAAAAPAPEDDPFIQEGNAQNKKASELGEDHRDYFHYFFRKPPKYMKNYVKRGIPYFQEIFENYRNQHWR